MGRTCATVPLAMKGSDAACRTAPRKSVSMMLTVRLQMTASGSASVKNSLKVLYIIGQLVMYRLIASLGVYLGQ